MIDGAGNNKRLIGRVAVRPSIDAIAETGVQANTCTAEVERTGGGIINVITGMKYNYIPRELQFALTFSF